MCPIPTHSFVFREGKYVRANGRIKVNNHGRRYLQLSHIRMSDDPHELYYHLADAMVTEVVLTRGPVSVWTPIYLGSVNLFFVSSLVRCQNRLLLTPKIGHSKGLKLAILAPFLADVLTSNLGPIRITLGMAGLPP
jgi:hypothetical protein